MRANVPPAFRLAALVACVLVLLLAAPGARADMIDLGTIKPQVSLFDVIVEPQVNLRVDVLTRPAEVNVRLDTYTSIDRALLVAKARAIIEKKLPLQFHQSDCTINITRLNALELAVSGFTGELKADVEVDPDWCWLPGTGSVRLTTRFVPHVEGTGLGIKLASVEVEVPSLWQSVARVAFRNLKAEIAARVRSFVAEHAKFEMPAIDGGRAAFQGASLDLKDGAVVLRIRGDGQIDREKAASLLRSLPQVNQLSFRIP